MALSPVSRIRWAVGLGVTGLSLVVATRALGAYLHHRLWLGSASVLLLAEEPPELVVRLSLASTPTCNVKPGISESMKLEVGPEDSREESPEPWLEDWPDVGAGALCAGAVFGVRIGAGI